MTCSLAWLSPFSKASDVSAFSKCVLSALANPEICPELACSLLVNDCGTRYWTDLPAAGLESFAANPDMLRIFDFVVYNLGNNHENHHLINKMAIQAPGVAIIHDMVMQHYLAWALFEKRGRPDLYAQMMADHYGEKALDVVEWSGICQDAGDPYYAPWDSPHAQSFPLSEAFASSAAALVVHSAFAETAVKRFFKGPVLRLQLPYDQKPALSARQVEEWAAASRRKQICSIVAFGHISRSKCLDLVIRAFAVSELLRARAQLRIVGYPGDRQHVGELRALVSAHGLGELVHMEFGVSNERLLEVKAEADIFVNLRWPNTESASGSLIEQLNTAKPAIVFNSGCYADLADDAALKLPPGSSAEAVAREIEKLVLDPELRIRVGAAGFRHARRIGSQEYAAGLRDFLLANREMLRRRRLYMAAGCCEIVAPAKADEAWITDLARARRNLRQGRDLDPGPDPVPFGTLAPEALERFIANGLFRDPQNAALRAELASLLRTTARIALFQTVSSAYELWRIARAGEMAAAPALLTDDRAWRLLAALGDAVFISACYASLLGRQAIPLEIENYEGRLRRGETYEAVLREFMTSEEFAWRRCATHQRRALESCVARLADLVRFMRHAPPPVAVGSEIVFGWHNPNSVRYLAGSWYELEAEGVWSKGSVAELAFQLERQIPQPVVIEADLRLGAALVATPQEIEVLCNGESRVVRRVDHADFIEVSFPVPAEDPKAITLVLDSRRSLCPAEAALGDDMRSLGVCLRRIRVLPG